MGGHLQGVAPLDGVRLIQQIAEGPADLLAVQDIHAALLINVDPQEPAAKADVALCRLRVEF